MIDARKGIAALLLGFTVPAAADLHDTKRGALLVVAATTAIELAEGEVRKVDKEAAKVTIRHGPIKHLDMPAMTMVFQVKDKAMLDKLKAGDKITFTAEQVNGAYTVMSIESTK